MALNKFNLRKKLDAFNKLKSVIPMKLGNESVNFFKQSFRGSQSGFIDNGLQKWPEVQRRRPGARRSRSKAGQTRAILVKAGELRDATRVKIATFSKILIVNDKDYAAVHNEGLRSGRGRGFKMPKRKFMGDSHELTKKHLRIIRNSINGAMK